MSGTILLGIDVESPGACSRTYATCGPEFLEREGIPATWYVTGRALEASPAEFQAADRHELVDIQAHTYSHLLLKTVILEVPPGKVIHGKTDWFMQRGASSEEVDADLARCQEVFAAILGRRPQGLTTPWGYYRGLADRPDLLDMVARHGFRFLRSWARDCRDGQPVPLERQPFFYHAQGHPDLLELAVQDYQDDFYYMMFNELPDASTYPDHLRQVADRVAAEDLVWSLCSHDHHCATPAEFAAKTEWIAAVVRYAKSIGIRFMSGADYYRECRP